MTRAEWIAVLHKQQGKCPVCDRVPPSGRLVTDHEHVKGWKKMPPMQRKIYVRLLTCWTCNTEHLGRGMTSARAKRLFECLLDYEERKKAGRGPADMLE